uniref:Glutathione peroxidase n=2 Tax=Plectus sambesii TaxID=2011161 RepID=A0A914WNU5_9BILA
MDAATSLLITALAHAGSHVLQHSVMRDNPTASEDPSGRYSVCKSNNQTIFNFMIEQRNGSFIDLHSYRGQVLLIVNVATYCYYTAQYLDFNGLIDSYGGDRFTILAFPCNQFYLQEPGSNKEILDGLKYVRPGGGWEPHPKMTIFGKVDVNGENQHALYEFLKNQCPPTTQQLGKKEELMYSPMRVNDISWNFEKILVDKKGRPRYRFHPTAWKDGAVVRKYIDELLNEPL